MDFQKIVDSLFAPTCIVSVEKKGDRYGMIRLVAGNRKYADVLGMRTNPFGTGKDQNTSRPFVPGHPYTEYFQQSVNFEDACYRAAILKKEVHTYAHIHNVDVWFDIYAMPLDYEEEDVCYCLYSAIPNDDADSLLDTFNTSNAVTDVLRTCVKLHKASNLQEAMDNVIAEIRQICNAEGCTVLLLDDEEEKYSILATNFVPNSTIKRVTQFDGYYKIAISWKDMLGEEGDCIIARNREEIENIGRINHPWYLTLVEAGVKSVALFPLRQGKELLGFMWAVNFDTENTQHIKETLELTSFFLSAHIAHYQVIMRLKHMGYTDALTGLPNRYALTEHVSGLIDKKERFTAVSIDLNDFKHVNNTYGFDAGNKVLIDVAARWRAVSDTVYPETEKYLTCIGGDEFFLVVSGYRTEEELEDIVACYNDALSDNLTVDDCDVYVSASFGCAEFPTDADTTDALISHANVAMNEIKKTRSSEHILRFTPELLKDEHILEIERVIRNALENDLIYFHLQPQYDMNHRLRGFEALARMKDGEGNAFHPEEFIPVAEKAGLIDRVDGTVARKAAMFFGDLLRRTEVKLTLSLNVSVRHMMKSDFIDEIRQLLKDSGIPANQIEIEITESIMIDSVDRALHCIDELKMMGVHIAIDDFGTGYSSLSYLNRFPAELLKIDKSFIDAMNSCDSSRQYVAAIISMGHIMGFDVISEGVEKPEQLETLVDIGCDYVQGFIWGNPLPMEDVEKLVVSMDVSD
ncbi:MAG: EAL domain-containing protein [Lachnospiraceae bacterium]|nr:EAL domain-containing protein [Lachnospiraceae bacterium]